MRLGDVIEKTQSELNTSKIQLSQIQRQEAQSRQELDSIRSLTNNKDKRGKELQVSFKIHIRVGAVAGIILSTNQFLKLILD